MSSSSAKSRSSSSAKKASSGKRRLPQLWLLPRLYLITFNAISGALWAAVFVAVVYKLAAVLTTSSSAAFYTIHNGIVMAAQALALMEVVHSAVGVVSSPTSTVLIQVGSRFLVLYGIVEQVSELQEHVIVLMLLLAWSLAEFPRYIYYALTMMDLVPYWLLVMRYSLFLVLYPMGITAELFCIYTSVPYFKSTKQWSIYMPNRINFEFIFYQALQTVLVLYMIGGPYMYFHMLRQRQKYLGPKANKSHRSIIRSFSKNAKKHSNALLMFYQNHTYIVSVLIVGFFVDSQEGALLNFRQKV